MTVYNIRYQTVNNYNSPVNEAYLNFLIIPLESDDQHCVELSIKNNLNARAQYSDSLYGAKLALFHLTGNFTSFELSMDVRIEKREWNFPTFKNLSIEEERKILNDEVFKLTNDDFIIHTKLTEIEGVSFPTEIDLLYNETVFKYIQRINAFIQGFLSYEINTTTPQTTVREIVQQRKGVCQDYSHLFIAIMRNNAVPARYVSGYLNQGKQYIGASAMHAWVEVYIPETGWLGIDPTNNTFVNDNYIKVAHGSDYIDCMPVKGIYRSDSGGTTLYTVKITEQQNQ
jgi:transglutaminase-like putative cysteine protease